MQLKEKRVFVFGAGKSGISATILLQKQGAYVILYDSNTILIKEDFADKIDINHNFQLVTGEVSEELIRSLDLLVISPGIAIDSPLVERIKAENIPVWGEIELAYRIAKGKIVGITGTNGKTTTTTLVGEIMKTYFNEVYVVGNIGIPYTDIAMDTTQQAVSVIELSSFQLETIHDFKPDVSAILNITPDHLNRHHTMDNYIAMKENIAKNQTMNEICVLNYEDETLRTMASRLKTRILFFSSANVLEDGLYLQGDQIIYSDHGEKQVVCNVKELKILGKHNYENVMAAVGMSVSMGVPMEYIRKAVLNFNAVEHRIEFVEKINGVTYYNDSKGTNPDAAIKAVQAMISPTIVIGGGYDKKIPFDDWIEAFDGKVKYLVLLGQTKDQIAATAREHGFHNIIMVNDLREAVKVSAEKAEPGDAVLLSPACASWGMFDNYEQRGRMFKEYVRELM
ncbi:UDP-N-acetylmuramoyl-L-alanine--D-glutamate ligase [Lachnospiraceae bacterium MD1]|jgi:UDP-N-acetylmuramoylalanine--D-glutamate ligase|uniref:UDP-N-acetylmuramoylalanine--D-glutamate ligase n=1 Tax=Variimorphobacter saccharofermentans TaxID=2755051 RepID=A0A839JZ84_9FIRM|nr:UDP-N-acetylmuramoyl-L-alanine--D-glutamate ligase [Variimorphobacter saccharofermentans]MBB2182710.1 UDP-N-acetylmuramoyl-L-alanine--D-glutamate ligase [Variimorphobacter saccharofermentans]